MFIRYGLLAQSEVLPKSYTLIFHFGLRICFINRFFLIFYGLFLLQWVLFPVRNDLHSSLETLLRQSILFLLINSTLIYSVQIQQVMDRELFEDRFKVDKIDPDNKTPFRNVSRVHLISYSDKQNRRFIEVDINIQIYPVSITDSFLIKVTNCDHIKNVYSQEEISKPSEKDSYDYVMYGVVFEIEEKNNELVIFASFGGLLMRVSGSFDAMAGFRKEGKQSRIYLMLKRA